MESKYPTVFHLAANEFGKAGISFLLVGGFAINQYKVSRVTVDVDFLMTEDAFQRALPILETEGYHPVIREHLFTRLRKQDTDLLPVDILFVDPQTFSKMWKEAKEIEMGGLKLRVPSLRHLIAMKLHALKNNPKHRENKDLYDVVELAKKHPKEISSSILQELCAKYASVEIYEKISSLVGPWRN